MRDVINKTISHKEYIPYYERWIDVVDYKEYSYFPSENSSGWPNQLQQHNLTALTTREYFSHHRSYRDGNLWSVSTAPDQYVEPSSFDKALIKQQAMNKAVSSFMDGKQQLWADFHERQSVIDMTGKRVYQAYDVLRNLRRGNLYKAVTILNGGKRPRSKKAASLHLEFVYGWAPLVGSISQICSREFPPNPEIYIKEFVDKPFYRKEDGAETIGKIRSSYSMLLRLNSPLVASASKLGLVNPASVAWELVPFSFIVDWFLPISDYLQSLDAFSGYTILDKCQSYSEKLYMVNDAGSGAVRQKTKKSIVRNIHVKPNMAPLPKSPLSMQHVLNTLSLIRVLRKD